MKNDKKMATGAKFLGRFFAILYLVSRFILWLMVDRDKTGRSLEFPGQKAQVVPMQTPLISLLPVSMIFFLQFSSNQQRKLRCYYVRACGVSIASWVEWESADKG